MTKTQKRQRPLPALPGHSGACSCESIKNTHCFWSKNPDEFVMHELHLLLFLATISHWLKLRIWQWCPFYVEATAMFWAHSLESRCTVADVITKPFSLSVYTVASNGHDAVLWLHCFSYIGDRPLSPQPGSRDSVCSVTTGLPWILSTASLERRVLEGKNHSKVILE